MLIACCGGKLYGIMPFGTPMFCALSCEFFIGFVAPIYILCEFLFTFEVWRLFTGCAVAIVMAVRWIAGLKFKRMRGGIAAAVFFAVSVASETAIVALFVPIANALFSGAVSVAFYFFCYRSAACAKSGLSVRPGVIEGAAISAVSFVFGLSCGRASYDGIIIGLAPMMLLLLLVDLAGSKALLAVGCSLALGLGVSAGLAFVPAVLVTVLVIVAFDSFPRPVYAIAAVGVFCALSVLFYARPIVIAWNALCVASGALLFCVLPRRTVRVLREYFDFDGTARLAVRHYINRSRADAGNRMLAVASVFDETARLMTALSPAPSDYVAIGMAMSDNVCRRCKNRISCDAEARKRAFSELARRASEGGAILPELPEFFTRDCVCPADVISEANVIAQSARDRAREREGEDKAKQIVVERLCAIKDVLEELGAEQGRPVGFDADRERKTVFELNNVGVECAEAFCSAENVTAIVRSGSASREKIRRAVSGCMRREHEIVSLERTQAAGWSVATLKKRPKYEAVYARAGCAKGRVTGDSYTFKRIGDRFLAALLDGMGTGELASENSSAAVELIECFYRAGFESKSVLTGVNRFLKLPTAENFSAADVVVCDLDSSVCDIIKIGAPPCYIKTTDTVLKISGSSLPIGVLDEMRPYVTTKRLYPGQMLILVSDGVSDCFSGDELPEFINGLSAFNPESAVKAILSQAKAMSGGEIKDDMTAIAFRLYEKRR